MTKEKPRNLAASVRQRLMNLARRGTRTSSSSSTTCGFSREFAFAGPLLSQAIRATFGRRRTPVPATVPVALSSEFVQDRAKQTQWRAFVAKSKLDTGGVGLEEVIDVLRSFLMPVAEAVAGGRLLGLMWPAAGPWRQRESDLAG